MKFSEIYRLSVYAAIRVALACTWLAASDLAMAADEAVPFLLPSDAVGNTNAVAIPIRQVAPAPGAPTPIGSPTPTVNFLALGDPVRGHPPDTCGAVGPNHVMTMLNTDVRIQDRTGGTNSTTTLSNWWSSVGPFVRVFDPKIVYDPFHGRWIAVVALNANTDITNAALAVAISTNSDPTGGWVFRRIDADANNQYWIDRPFLGFNKKFIAVNVNMVDSTPVFHHSRFYVFDKTNAYGGGTNYTYAIRDNGVNEGGSFAPALTYDNDQENLYLVQSTAFPGGRAGRIWTIDGTPSNPGYSLNPGKKLVGTVSWSRFATDTNSVRIDSGPQTNTTVKIATNDDRMDSVVVRNGSLWVAHTIFLGSALAPPQRSAIQWFQYSIAGDVVVQTGIIDDPAGNKHYGFPSIAVNKYDDALIGFTLFSTTGYASAAYAFRARTDNLRALRSTHVYKNGVGIYYRATANRWGDYSATVVDPVNDTDLWTIQEYAEAPNGTGLTNGNGRFGTWWAKVAPPVPANDTFESAFQISGSSGSTNGILFRATEVENEPVHAGSILNQSIWYKWTAPANGNVTFHAVGSSEFLRVSLAVYTGTSVTNLTLVASNDDASNPEKPKLSFSAANGTTYRIALAPRTSVADGSDATVLNWIQPSAPYFTTHPSPAENNVVASDSLTLTSLALGAPSPTYRWYKNTNTLISGATSANYTFNSIQLSDQGTYHVVASNSVGVSTSFFAKVWTYTNGTASFHTDSANFVYTNNYFKIHVSGVTNHAYTVQATTNYTNWEVVATNSVASFWYTNFPATNIPLRIFRVVY